MIKRTTLKHKDIQPWLTLTCGRSLSSCIYYAFGSFVLSMYMKTMYPSIPGGDSGELVAEACHLGIAHPPGYPLYILILHLFLQVAQHLSVQYSAAYIANFSSALLNTFAIMLFYQSLILYHEWRHCASSTETPTKLSLYIRAACAAGLLAFSPLIWTYAVGAEVFAMNNFFVALLLYQLILYARNLFFLEAMKGAIYSGLALCNQHTIVLQVFPIAVYVLYTRYRVHMSCKTRVWKEFCILSLSFLAGISIYAYLPLSGAYNAHQGSWGHVRSWSGFWHHVRRGDYGTFRLYSASEKSEGLYTRTALYFQDLHTQQGLYIILPLACIGCLYPLYRKPKSSRLRDSAKEYDAQLTRLRQTSALLMFMYFFYIVVFHALANLPLDQGLMFGVHMRFWQQPNFLAFFFAGVGMDTYMHAMRTQRSRIRLHFAFMALTLFQIRRHYFAMDQSNAFYVEQYAQAILDPLPKNAVLLINYDLQWTSLRYLQICEHRRQDVILLHLSMMTYSWFSHQRHLYPNLAFPGSNLNANSNKNFFTLTEFVHANIKNFERNRSGIYCGGKLYPFDQGLYGTYQLVPYGLVDEIVRVKKIGLKRYYTKQCSVRSLVQRRLYHLPDESVYDDRTWENTIARDFRMKELQYATFLLEQTIAQDFQNVSLLLESTFAMEYSVQFESKAFWSPNAVLKNLGLAYAQIVKSKQAIDRETIEKLPEPFSWHKKWKKRWRETLDPFAGNEKVLGLSNVNFENALGKWKGLAAQRMLQVWKEWLALPEAQTDPGYSAVKELVYKFSQLEDASPS